MKLNRTMKRALAYVCAIALVISSITVYNQTAVKASGSATVDGIVYTVTDGDATIVGFTCQGIFDKARIHFAWGTKVDENSITATVDGKAVTVDGKNTNGMFIPLSEVSGLAEGEYQIAIKATATEEAKEVTGNATLKIQAEGETTTRDSSIVVWKDLGEGFSYDDNTTATVINIQQPGFATEKGIYVNVPAGINKVSVNGVSGDTVGAIQGAGIVVYLSALTYQTNNVIIEYAGGTATVNIKNANGTGGDAPTVETTTAAPITDGDELLKNTAFADSSNWNEFGFTSATNNGDGSLTLAIEAKTEGDNWSSQLVQNGLSLTEGKWYVAKYTVTSDVDKTFQLLLQSDGAAGGDWSVFSENLTEVKAGETKDVEMKFQASKTGNNNVLFGLMMGYVNNTASEAANVVISNVSLKVYNSDPAGDETTTPEPSTDEETTPEPSTDEETTPEPSTEDTTTAATSELVWTDAVADSKWYTNGNWEYYFGDWNASQGKVAVDSENPNRVAIVATNSLWHDAWGTQIKFVAEGLTPGATYTISYDIIADNNNGKIKTSASDAEIALVAGKQTVSRTDAADENGKLELAVGMGWVGLNNKLIMENLKVVDAEGNEVNPKPDKPDETTTPSNPVETTTPSDPVETTTPSDSDETTAPSKPDETTTPSEPKTDNPTVAPTAAPKKVNVPKVKVKSASKKKASKKVKISLKKVKGAKKYQVQISKTKKFKKVLVKKTVKKAKFTIKSKKIKNKKKLYVRAKAIKIVGGKSYKGKWSRAKKIKIKK